jgi:hypothetical protein
VLVVVGITSVLGASLGDDVWLALPAIVGAAVVELIRPALGERRRGFRLLSWTMPTVLTAMHFAALSIWDHVTWTVELWAGTIVGTGLVGVLVSLVVWPPGTDAV